ALISVTRPPALVCLVLAFVTGRCADFYAEPDLPADQVATIEGEGVTMLARVVLQTLDGAIRSLAGSARRALHSGDPGDVPAGQQAGPEMGTRDAKRSPGDGATKEMGHQRRFRAPTYRSCAVGPSHVKTRTLNKRLEYTRRLESENVV